MTILKEFYRTTEYGDVETITIETSLVGRVVRSKGDTEEIHLRQRRSYGMGRGVGVEGVVMVRPGRQRRHWPLNTTKVVSWTVSLPVTEFFQHRQSLG